MNINDFYADFNDINSVNSRIDLLWELVVKKDQRLIRRLVYLIRHPLIIKNHNQLAAILVELDNERFIQPLFDTILEALSAEPDWIKLYLTALVEIVDEEGKQFQLSEQQTDSLLGWAMSKQLSTEWLDDRGHWTDWRSMDHSVGLIFKLLLRVAKNEVSKRIFIESIQNTSLPFPKRYFSTRALLIHYGDYYRPWLQEVLIREEDPNFKQFLSDTIKV